MLGNGIAINESAKAQPKKAVISATKLANKDIVETARFIYLISPVKFAKLARVQGFEVQNIQDVITLAENTKRDQNYFNFGRLYRTMKISATELTEARKNKIKVM